jgi:hypothetical protein
MVRHLGTFVMKEQRLMFQNPLQSYDLLSPREPAVLPSGFMLCPVSLWQSGSLSQQQVQRLYDIAWENARAMTRPSLRERDLFAVWN